MKTSIVCGAGGFIGSHLVKKLKKEGFWVRGVDLKFPEFSPTEADEFIISDLRDPVLCKSVIDQKFDEVFQLGADMGGAGYIFTGEHDADVMHNSATINLNMSYFGNMAGIKKIFYSSSACYTLNITSWILIILNALKNQLIQQIQIANTGGKNYSVKDCIFHFSGNIIWML